MWWREWGCFQCVCEEKAICQHTCNRCRMVYITNPIVNHVSVCVWFHLIVLWCTHVFWFWLDWHRDFTLYKIPLLSNNTIKPNWDVSWIMSDSQFKFYCISIPIIVDIGFLNLSPNHFCHCFLQTNNRHLHPFPNCCSSLAKIYWHSMLEWQEHEKNFLNGQVVNYIRCNSERNHRLERVKSLERKHKKVYWQTFRNEL